MYRYVISRCLAKQDNKVSITVAIETGIQNMGIPIVMLQVKISEYLFVM